MTGHFEVIRDFYVASNAVIAGDIEIGKDVNVWFGCILRGDLARITLGQRVNLQDGTIVHTDFDAPMVIEDDVVVGHGAILHGARIGRESLIGMGARLLGGCEIGEQCLVAAGSVVTEARRIPPRSVVMGTPAKVIRPITDDELRRTREICAHYLEMAHRYVRGAFPPPWARDRSGGSEPQSAR